MDAYIKSLDEQIDAVYRTSGGPEPVIFANIEAKALSAKFIARVSKRKTVSVHVKRQMELCLSAIEQAKDAAAKAFMMPEVEDESYYTGRMVVQGDPTKSLDILVGYSPEASSAKKAKVEEEPAAAASSSSSFQKPRACGHDQRGSSKVEPCKTLIHPMMVACADCMPDVLAGKAARACPHGCAKHFDKDGCPDCKIQADRDAEDKQERENREAAAASSSSSAPRSTVHVVKVKFGESCCSGCNEWRSGWSVLQGYPLRVSCDVCNTPKIFERSQFREIDSPEASN